MKDNLFEMLLHLFDTSLTQLQRSHKSDNPDSQDEINEDEILNDEDPSLYVKSAKAKSTRIFTYEEQMKLTKASYQFLMRMKLWNILDVDLFELIITQLYSSESRIVTLQETKWTIRNVLENTLNEEQLAFLDLVLYQSEDELTIH